MSEVYKANWDRVRDVKFKKVDSYDVPYGRDKYGRYGELMPDGYIYEYSHFDRLDDFEGIGRLYANDDKASFMYGDCYYGFGENYYEYCKRNGLKPGKFVFYPHPGTENYRTETLNAHGGVNPIKKYDEQVNFMNLASNVGYFYEQKSKGINKDNENSI